MPASHESWNGEAIAGALLLGMLMLVVGWYLFVKSRGYPYKPCRQLLTRPELAFYKILSDSVPAGIRIMAKVRLGDVITCSERDWHAGHGPPISAKHLDFVLIAEADTRILGAIELDDKSHNRHKRRQRDKFVNNAMHAAGVPLVRFPLAHIHDKQALADALKKIIPIT